MSKSKKKRQSLELGPRDCTENEPAILTGIETVAGKCFLKYRKYHSQESAKPQKVLYVGKKTNEELTKYMGKLIPLMVVKKSFGHYRNEPAACMVANEI